MKLEFSTKSIKKFFQGFLPSKYILLISILFYILGIVFTFVNPDQARLTFHEGFFLLGIEEKIQLPHNITLEYVLNQFIFYLGVYHLKFF